MRAVISFSIGYIKINHKLNSWRWWVFEGEWERRMDLLCSFDVTECFIQPRPSLI